MNNKSIGYVLIALGALDYIIWILNDFNFGWLELIVGVNYLSQYGSWVMIAIGIHMSRSADIVDVNVVPDSQNTSNDNSMSQIEAAVEDVQKKYDQDSGVN